MGEPKARSHAYRHQLLVVLCPLLVAGTLLAPSPASSEARIASGSSAVAPSVNLQSYGDGIQASHVGEKEAKEQLEDYFGKSFKKGFKKRKHHEAFVCQLLRQKLPPHVVHLLQSLGVNRCASP